MSLARLLLVAALTLAIAAPSLADCPVDGTWSTTTQTMLGGRVTEAFCGANGEPLQPGRPGNTQNAESWDGVLGQQWRVWGMAIDAAGPSVSGSLDGNGDGILTYTTNYDGGQFWLSGAHTWSTGGDLTGSIEGYVVVATATVRNFVTVGLTSNVSFSGTFDNCVNDCVIDFAIANAILIGSGPQPTDYPTYLCGATSGEWFDACCITMSIYCPVSTKESSWGHVKDLYR